MRVRSLAYRTDLALLATGGQLRERDGYLAVRSPRQPTFYWGNLLLFPGAPVRGDLARWEARFREEFADLPGVTHRAFGWDDPNGDAGDDAEFLAAGFTRERCEVLTAGGASLVAAPPHATPGLEVRPLASDADWEAATENQVACRDEAIEEEGWRRFRTEGMAAQRERVEAGRGLWLGAFLAGRLVGDLGLFVTGEVGRFQDVATAPGARRRGVCGTLVHAAARDAFERRGARTLAIVADPAAGAIRVYRSLGFRTVERQAGLCRPSPRGPRGGADA